MKRINRRYPEHPCIKCGTYTTNKSYCDDCISELCSPVNNAQKLLEKSPDRRRKQDVTSIKTSTTNAWRG